MQRETLLEGALAERLAGLGRAGRLHRWWPLALAVLLVVAAALDRHAWPADTELFTAAGRVLLSPGGLGVFGDPILQVGIAQLSFYALVSDLEAALGLPRYLLLSILIQGGVLAAALGGAALPYRLRGRPVPPGLLLAVGFVTTTLGLGSALFRAGHPAQVVIGTTWVLAALAARRGRPITAGLLLAAGMAWEPWGLLGAPVLLLAPRILDTFKASLTALTASAACYAPFAVLGEFRMGEYDWVVRPTSMLTPWLPEGMPFGWELRLLQACLAVAVGALVALALRHSVHALWAVPLATATARLAVDPVGASYYWVLVQLLAFMALATFLAMQDLAGWVAFPLLYPLFLPVDPGLRAGFGLAAVAVVALHPLWAARRAPRPHARVAFAAVPEPRA